MAASKIKHFDISSHVVIQLGEQLITDGLTALLELAKNSYDAGSKFVKITANTIDQLPNNLGHQWPGSEKGYVIVEDQGCGMSEQDVLDSWLNIASSKKRVQKKENKIEEGSRYPLGDKGLGRLSTQRIGSFLELRTIKDEIETTVLIDWSQFIEDRKLGDIEVRLSTLSKIGSKNGTTIIVSGLRDVSDFTSSQELEKQLLQLISPHELSMFKVFATHNGAKLDLDSKIGEVRNLANYSFDFEYVPNDDSGRITLSGKVRLSSLISKRGEKEKRESFEEHIDSDGGKRFFEYLINGANGKPKLEKITFHENSPWFLSFEWNFDGPATTDNQLFKAEAEPGQLSGLIDSFALDDFDDDPSTKETLDSIPSFTEFGDFKSFIQGQIGIRVYRDGFAIRPFGFEGNDWLNLGKEKTKGSSFYSLRPGNTVGSIRITAKDNKNLVETTAREGLIQNLAFQRFYKILEAIRDKINSELIQTIRRNVNSFLSELDSKNSVEIGKITPASAEIIKEGNKAAAELLPDFENEIKNLGSKLNEIPKEGSVFFVPSEHKPARIELETQIERKTKEITILKAAIEAPKAVFEAKSEKSKARSLKDELDLLFELASLGMAAELLSHEISNITMNLTHRSKSILDDLRQNRDKNPELLRYAESVQSATSALRKQISHLNPSLRYVREVKTKIHLDRFLEDLVNFHKERLENKRISIELDLSPANLVNMNIGRLSQVMDNLIANSEYWLENHQKSKQGFHGVISIHLLGGVIQLKDNGKGVDPHYENTLFQPFVSGKDKGRGLGLYICDKLLEAVGGTIRLKGEKNVHGNRYIFEIDLNDVK